MKRLICALILCVAVAGCATTAPAPLPPISIVPCKAPPPVVRPHLPIADLADDASYQEQLKAYALSILLLQEYARGLEELLDGYRVKERAL